MIDTVDIMLEKQLLDCLYSATEQLYICAKPGHVTHRNFFGHIINSEHGDGGNLFLHSQLEISSSNW